MSELWKAKNQIMNTPLGILFMIIFISGFATGSVGYLASYHKKPWNLTLYLMKIFSGVFLSAVSILIYEFFMGSAVISQQQNLLFYIFMGCGCFVVSLLTFLSANLFIDKIVNPTRDEVERF